MKQNRVNPFGDIVSIPERGQWLGNRGVIHNQMEHIVRPYKLKAWITCLLAFKNRRFKIMAPGRWTQLFFMDEATALSAGHRPCAECRRQDFTKFKTSWIEGNPGYGFTKKTSIREIDAIIHAERIDANHQKITFWERPTSLPDGIFVCFEGQPHLIFGKQMYRWTAAGYALPIELIKNEQVEVLTPKSVVNAIQYGYVPQVNL